MKSLLPIFILLFPSFANAQIVGGQWEMLHQFDGIARGDHLGVSVSSAGDVNGDGLDDLIVGAPSMDPAGINDAGSAFVYCGVTGTLIWQFDGQGSDENLGSSVSNAGDVDGDGFSDLIVGIPHADPGGLHDAGQAHVYSGATGTLIWQFEGLFSRSYFGNSVSGVGDIDADGFHDVIVGAFWADPGNLLDAGSAYVYSGATGLLLRQFDGLDPSDRFGFSVSGSGDVDGDGFPDLIIGAISADVGGLNDAGSAYVYSGATGNLIWQFDGAGWGDGLGSSVSCAGDVDGDDLDDFIVGASEAGPGGGAATGLAYVYSGASGQLIWQFEGTPGADDLGYSVSGAGDVDQDGFADLIVGARFTSEGLLNQIGKAYVYSGATGELLWCQKGVAAYDQLGWSVSGAGDVDGDGFSDLIIGARGANPGGIPGAGSAFVWSLNPFLHTEACELSAASGTPVTLGLDFPDSEAGKQYAILSSINGTGPTTIGGIDVPLTNDAMLQRMLIGWSPSNMTSAFGVLNVNGDARATIASDPILAQHIGKTYYLAAITYDGITQTARLSSIARTIKIVP